MSLLIGEWNNADALSACTHGSIVVKDVDLSRTIGQDNVSWVISFWVMHRVKPYTRYCTSLNIHNNNVTIITILIKKIYSSCNHQHYIQSFYCIHFMVSMILITSSFVYNLQNIFLCIFKYNLHMMRHTAHKHEMDTIFILITLIKQ